MEEELSRLVNMVEELRRENNLIKNHPTFEPVVSLPAKFDGNKYYARDFINQVKLIFQLQPSRYHNDYVKVGFIGTLLTGSAASWFSPFLEQNSPVLSSFDLFIQEFNAAFGDFDRAIVAANEIRALTQGQKSASDYASKFRQISSDLNWGEQALIDQFRRGLRNDVKDLMITLPYPSNLNEAVAYAVRCDNRLAERKLEKSQNYQPIRQNHMPIPMEIDYLRYKKLTQEEKNRRKSSNLCLYCGEPGHVVKSCPLKLKQQGKSRVQSQ